MVRCKSRWAKILLCSLFLSGCHNDTGGGSAPPYIRGLVVQYGEDITPLRDSSGVTIVADGPVRDSLVTGASGHWAMKGLPKGVYTVVFSKSGFGINKIFGVKFSGSREIDLGRIVMVRKPAYTVASFSVDQSDTGIHVMGNLAVDSGYDYGSTVVFLMDTTHAIFSDPTHYIGSMTTFTPYPSTAYALTASNPSLQTMLKVVAGTPIYIAAYPASALCAFSGYPDTATGNWVYTAIGDSALSSSFTMP